jgi:hypothetical protein
MSTKNIYFRKFLEKTKKLAKKIEKIFFILFKKRHFLVKSGIFSDFELLDLCFR